MAYEKCSECNQEYSGFKWCRSCNSKNFQNDFNNWTSGNDQIDKFIQDVQLNADFWKLIEWIPCDRFKDVEKIVALKKFDNFVKLNDVLNEMAIHLKTYTKFASIQFYGITQDPKTYSYMMVLEYIADGNLREYLKINFNNINWFQKLRNLYYLSLNLMDIHELDIVHQDFHPGNILSSDFKDSYFLRISDFGLSKLIGTNPNNPEKKNIFGVLPYIAPEVLSDLAMKICNGLRPKIPFHTPKLITATIMRCWDARVTNRPTFKELRDELVKYLIDYRDYLEKGKNKDLEIGIQIKKAEEFSANQESTNTTTTTKPPLNYQTHPQAIYTS
ncbi:hypothetical protein Glove_132g101 [Diversispora epigaea]|uniref:Protein kinase domain-containing protein n=1 Tax=Diversispora epigaea TaxID=1348612 RepID=A0A397J6D9_9GLOM|nr:hypothetical protein Glove_132g101 [Diversispora epigaea]